MTISKFVLVHTWVNHDSFENLFLQKLYPIPAHNKIKQHPSLIQTDTCHQEAFENQVLTHQLTFQRNNFFHCRNIGITGLQGFECRKHSMEKTINFLPKKLILDISDCSFNAIIFGKAGKHWVVNCSLQCWLLLQHSMHCIGSCSLQQTIFPSLNAVA